jgi:hypothetical protein
VVGVRLTISSELSAGPTPLKTRQDSHWPLVEFERTKIEQAACTLLPPSEFARFHLLPRKPDVIPWVALCDFERPIPSLRPSPVVSKRIQGEGELRKIESFRSLRPTRNRLEIEYPKKVRQTRNRLEIEYPKRVRQSGSVPKLSAWGD